MRRKPVASMTPPQSAKEIDDEAADWAVRLDARDIAMEDDPELQVWLAQDHRRHGALLRAQAALSLMDRSRVFASDQQPPAPPVRQASGASRRMVLAGTGAAMVGAASLGGGYLWITRPQRLETRLGEIRRVPLDDGSLVDINTRTALELAMKPDERLITLKTGEAWFKVKKDKTRPFVVAAGPVRVRAVGTAFSVHRRGEHVEVMVTEGVVETWSVDDKSEPRRMEAGHKLSLSPEATPVLIAASTEIERNLAWRNGEISLDGETLAEAADQFNRYNTRKIIIDDPELAQQRFVGLFRTDEPQSFAAAVSLAAGAVVDADDDAIRLRKKLPS